MSCVTSNSPYAPAPLACTTRSGIRSRSKWARRSIKWKSCRRRGPFCPTLWLDSGSLMGQPFEVVYVGFSSYLRVPVGLSFATMVILLDLSLTSFCSRWLTLKVEQSPAVVTRDARFAGFLFYGNLNPSQSSPRTTTVGKRTLTRS